MPSFHMSDPTRKSCCTWPIVAAFFLCLGVGLACAWIFAPIDSTLEKYLPDFEENESPPTPPTTSPTPAPPSYEFIQCADTSATCCNGLDNICDLRPNEVLFAGSHNAMSSEEGDFLVGFNHKRALEGSLEAGYRMINLDVCNCNGGELQLCHNVCDYGDRNAKEVFQNMFDFLEREKSEILLLNFQIATIDGAIGSLDALYGAMGQVDGFLDMVYVHDDPDKEWPTLRTLIDENKRLLVFHHNGPNCETGGECPVGLHYYFDHFAETRFAFDSKDDLKNYGSSCAMSRGGEKPKKFFAINNFVTPPKLSEAQEVNEKTFLQDRFVACVTENNDRMVNVIYSDFWSEGDLPEVTQVINKRIGDEQTGRQRARMFR